MALGSSIGDRRATLERTVRRLDRAPGTRVLRVSRWWRTPPMRGGTARGWFLNGVAVLETELSPLALLDLCIALEAGAVRRRARYWGDRTLDLDVLLHTGAAPGASAPRLVLPHPGIRHRPFVLRPLLEAWPGAVDPASGRPWADLADLRGPDAVPHGVMAWRREALRDT